MKDILKDKSLKEMPYSVPDGYFEGLKAGLKMIPAQKRHVRRNVWQWTAAAAVTVLIAAGAFLMGRYTDDEALTEEDYIVYSGETTDIAYEEYTGQYADASAITEDDIIEYLIYIGIEVEELEEY